jgi:signal transduction histidine kinase
LAESLMSRTLLFLLLMLGGIAQAVETTPPSRAPLRVLMVFPGDLLMPWGLTQSEITKGAIQAAVPERVEFFAEGLDGLRLPGGVNLEQEFVTLLNKRYAEVPPDLIVVHGPMEGFVERQRTVLWPKTPWMVVSAISVPGKTPAFPDGIPGTSVGFDSAATVDLALRLQPDAKRVVIVGGSSVFGRAEIQRAMDQLEPYRQRLDIQLLVDLPMDEMARRLAALPHDSFVLHLPVFRDGTGAIRPAVDLAAELAAASSVPGYTYYDTALGVGVLGGAMANWEGQREMIGVIARELLSGEGRRESLVLHEPVPTKCVVDWRQMKRWHLSLDRLPDGCEVRFRDPGLWEQFHREALIALGVLLIQSALIIALVLQRRRRHRVQVELQEQRAQLAHAMRLATVGELSASIAHEINQPLAAILSNAEAGEALLKSGAGAEKLPELNEILSAIRLDDVRAGEVIDRMRRLLHNEPVAMRALNVNEAVVSIVRLTRGLAMRNGISVQTALDPSLPSINGDFVQIQQVLLNLVMNAIEAVQETAPDRRRVVITTLERPAGNVEVEVKDSGPGMAPEKLGRIFDPFFTTKPNGMGLGLPISRSIVLAHRGQIRADSDATGTRIRFILPV